MSLYNLWNKLELYGALLLIATLTVLSVWQIIDPLSYGQFTNSVMLYFRGAPSSMIYLDYTHMAIFLAIVPVVFYLYLRIWQTITGQKW